MNMEKYRNRPNLFRVATAIAGSKDPDSVLEAMRSLIKRDVAANPVEHSKYIIEHLPTTLPGGLAS